MSQCWIINFNYLYVLISTEAFKSLKVCSVKQVFTILNVTSYINGFFLKTRQIHNEYPCNLYKRHIFYKKNYVQLDPKHMNQNCFHAIAQTRHCLRVYIIKITIFTVHLTLILNLKSPSK